MPFSALKDTNMRKMDCYSSKGPIKMSAAEIAQVGGNPRGDGVDTTPPIRVPPQYISVNKLSSFMIHNKNGLHLYRAFLPKQHSKLFLFIHPFSYMAVELPCKALQEELGIDPTTLRLVLDPLYSLSHGRPTICN